MYSQTMLLTVITPEQFPLFPWAIIWWSTCSHKPRSVSSMQILRNRPIAYFRVSFQVRIQMEKLRKVTKQRPNSGELVSKQKIKYVPPVCKTGNLLNLIFALKKFCLTVGKFGT